MLSKGRAAVNRIGLGLILGGVLLTATPAGAGILDASWTAPTTNSDGSPLTDLASYRLYYGTSATPCPGASFSQFASPTPSPPANQSVTARLTGLSAGTLYNVSVTAVDASGSESACATPLASAVARIDFAASPTGTVSFGSVSVGSFADRVFTVSNTGGGTVSGNVSASAPFRIVSGSPFSLAGLGATQAVTVRFTPTTSATATTNVGFVADGDTLSRIVTGTGTDTTAPTVTITAPTSGPTYITSTTPLTLGGTASDNVGVTQVTWTNSQGASGTATGTTSWTASGIALLVGTNGLTVTARDAAGNTKTVSLTVTLSGTAAFTDDPVVAQSTPVKAVHLIEARAAIDSVRAVHGLPTFGWTDPALTQGITPAKAVHLTELRTALNQAYQAASRALPTYTDATVVTRVTVITAVQLNELRTAVRALQ